MELVDSEIGLFSISCLFKMVEGGVLWMFSGVYGPVERNLKEIFWEELGSIRGWWEGPWCLGGDFNEILSPSERVRGGNITPPMRRFAEIVNEMGLRDLPLQGGPYTWSGGRNGRSMSRLDRFLVSSDWECQYSKVVQKCLPRPISDHFPILLDSDGVRTGPSPFRFELMWLKFRGFKELLKGWWQNLKFLGSFSYILAAKLKALKGILKSWNMEVFGRVDVKKKEALQRVSFWDGLEKQRELILEEREERIRAKEEFKSWALMEEISWRQKSRELWLKDGDKNTGYFHKMANAHRRRNCLGKININGKMLENEAEIKVGLIEAFKNLFSAPSEWRPSLPDLSFDEIGLENATKLEEDFSEEEIWTTISGLNGDKAPGPDGFPLAFWSFNWDFVKTEVLGFFKEFHEQGQFVRSINATFLVLIPKKQNVSDLKDLRPISLVGGLYKILAKVLANRIKRVLSKVISPEQSAFVEGKQILDAVLIANEAVDTIIRRKENGIVCKLDIEKAYDHLSWEFLIQVLDKMGFGRRWVSWVKWCISTASFSILVNGSPTGFFQNSRGLRQGDPLSPYLFVIGMEALSRLLKRAVDGNYLSGSKIAGRDGVVSVISHLLYADDTLLFCGASKDQLKFLSWILMWFEALSGLKINLNKSEIFPVGSVENVSDLAVELGCGIGSLPSSYLGLPLGASHKALGVWDTVEDKFRKRLASWKSQYISKAGRLTLIQSTLSSLPIYCLSLFRMPVSICSRLEKIQREYLWGGGSLVKKTHLVNWKTVCTEKKKGGLGLRRFSILNKALLCKWCWRFANERESLWRKVIRSKFGEDYGGWSSGDIKGGFGVGLWKDIKKEWTHLCQNTYLALGNGSRISFWEDAWCGEEALSLSFPNLFRLTAQKFARVADLWNWESGEGGWNPIFTRSFNDWEMEEVDRFLQILCRKQINPLLEDKILFKGSRNEGFSVKIMYRVLDCSPQVEFPSRSIWNPVIPPRWGFFAW